MRIYHEAFPAAQRVADSALLKLVPRGMNDPGGWLFHLAECPPERTGSDTNPIGFVAGLYVSPIRMGYIAYLAVRSDWRGRGAGTGLFRSLIETWMETRPAPPRWIFLEVERPELATGDEERAQRLRRMHFYERLGFRPVAADFQAPPLGPKLPVVPYRILVLPLADATLDQASLRVALVDIYREVYGLEEDHPLVANCIQSMRMRA